MKALKLGKYHHYKGRDYEVLGIAIDSESLEEMVLYKPLYLPEKRFTGKYWVRKKAEFFEDVQYNGKSVPRYKFISPA